MMQRRRTRPLTVLLLVAILVVIANWTLGPRFYPSHSVLISEAVTTIGVVCLLIFGTLDSARRRLRERKRKNAVT
jgi:arginine exporter protein ArgO